MTTTTNTMVLTPARDLQIGDVVALGNIAFGFEYATVVAVQPVPNMPRRLFVTKQLATGQVYTITVGKNTNLIKVSN